ncbi:MAG: efflux RND transporter periplasmic adaptor subunit [Phycisphaerales bacterium]|nr:efflux RND transporter periplasmic adaptor subunit [Phycisphaerales bacterium]
MNQSPAVPERPSILGRFWAFIRILNVRLRFIFLMVLVGVVSANWENLMNRYDRWRRPVQASDMVSSAAIEYYCPMHPNIIRGEPGNCPICGMPLSKRAKTGQAEMPPDALARIQLSPYKVQMGRIGTIPIEYRLLAREIRTVGIIDYDETRRAFIPARIKGRIDELFVNFIGQQVEEGAPLVSIYSPDLLVAQEELITANQRVRDSPSQAPALRQGAENLFEAAKRKLELWGVTREQVNAIIERGTPETHLTIFSPIAGIVTEKNVLEGHYVNEGDDLYTIADLRNVWLQAKVFENDLAGVAIGTAVEVTSVAFPDEVFAGRITFIAYTVDPGTRTVSARVEIDNPDLRLRPGMYVRAAIRLPVGRVEYVDAASQPASQAVSGTRPYADAYLKVATAFAADKKDDAALAEMARQAEELAKAIAKAQQDKAREILSALQKLKGKELKEQRELFKKVSALSIAMLKESPPHDVTLSMFNCPMAKADWLGVGEDVRNPYYGSEMLECGSVTGKLEPRSVQEDERFATGYFCPVYPDRLFDQPQHCPIDKFPLKRARVEKTLAVPELAVINTGTRQVVYRETEPGVFDMVEVKLGARAGEYFPVLGGLSAGDKIAARGSFLVDAENRLNPAASATYFGASGGPQDSGGSQHQH